MTGTEQRPLEREDDVQGHLLPLLAGAVVVVFLASGCRKEPASNDLFRSDGLPSSASRG